MRKILVLCVIGILAAGCGAKRIMPFAPRRPDIPEHRNVRENNHCLNCHDLKGLSDHARSDDCLSCHHMIRGR
jgi:hypothetical protein